MAERQCKVDVEKALVKLCEVAGRVGVNDTTNGCKGADRAVVEAEVDLGSSQVEDGKGVLDDPAERYMERLLSSVSVFCKTNQGRPNSYLSVSIGPAPRSCKA